MFETLKLRFFVAAVQAELKAQHDDQAFVNQVCQSPENINHLRAARTDPYFPKGKIGAFMATCLVLAESMDSEELSKETKDICARLLVQRLRKAAANEQFRLRHLFFFGRLEERVVVWAQQPK
jgi:hypothetical protein